jgi:hypothetical protein
VKFSRLRFQYWWLRIYTIFKFVRKFFHITFNYLYLLLEGENPHRVYHEWNCQPTLWIIYFHNDNFFYISVNKPDYVRYISISFFCVVKGPAADVTDAPQPWGLLCNPVMKMISFFLFPCNETPVEWNWQVKTEVLGKKLIPVPLCQLQIPHELTRNRTQRQLNFTVTPIAFIFVHSVYHFTNWL